MPEPHYPFHDNTVLVTLCGRLCLHRKKINLSKPFAGQAVGIKEVEDGIWLVSFMDYDLGYIDLEEKTLQPLENPFGPKVLPMSFSGPCKPNPNYAAYSAFIAHAFAHATSDHAQAPLHGGATL